MQFRTRLSDQSLIQERLWMLNRTTALLKKHKVPYWLDGGTLLAAFRHGRFLPWDDDVDVTVPIRAQAVLFGPVREEAMKDGIVIRQRGLEKEQSWCQPHCQGYYDPLVRYLGSGRAPRLHALHRSDVADHDFGKTEGYFADAWYKDARIDLWQAFPVALDEGEIVDARGEKAGKLKKPASLYSRGGGRKLFSKKDIFPLRKCQLEGVDFECPARSRRYLLRTYEGDLSPPDWRPWWSEEECAWRKDGIYDQKFNTTTNQKNNTNSSRSSSNSNATRSRRSNSSSLNFRGGTGRQKQGGRDTEEEADRKRKRSSSTGGSESSSSLSSSGGGVPSSGVRRRAEPMLLGGGGQDEGGDVEESLEGELSLQVPLEYVEELETPKEAGSGELGWPEGGTP